jgi:hypothetical protein
MYSINTLLWRLNKSFYSNICVLSPWWLKVSDCLAADKVTYDHIWLNESMGFTKLIVKIYIQHFLYPTSNSCEQCQLLSNRVKYQQNLDIYTKFIHSYIWHERMRRIKANEVNFNSIQSLYLCWVNFLVLMPVRFSTYLWLPQERRSQAISHGDTESINLFVFFYSFPDWNGQGPGQPSPSIHCLAAMSPVVVTPPPAPWRPTLAPLCIQISKVFRHVSENKDN